MGFCRFEGMVEARRMPGEDKIRAEKTYFSCGSFDLEMMQ